MSTRERVAARFVGWVRFVGAWWREPRRREGAKRWVRFVFRSATEDTEEHREGRWVRFVIPMTSTKEDWSRMARMKSAHGADGAQRAEVLRTVGVAEGVEQQLYKKEVRGGSRRGPGRVRAASDER
jgi:hypothetical protein